MGKALEKNQILDVSRLKHIFGNNLDIAKDYWQQLQDGVDEWFEEIIFPSIIVLDDLMSKAALSKVNVKDIAFPKNLLKQARASIQNELKPIKPRAKKGSTAADIQIDDLQARAEAGEFGPGRRSWFKDSKARNRAKEIVQQ